MEKTRRPHTSDAKTKKNQRSSVLNGRVAKEKPRKKKEDLQLAQEIATAAHSAQSQPTEPCHSANLASGRLTRCDTCSAWYRG